MQHSCDAPTMLKTQTVFDKLRGLVSPPPTCVFFCVASCSRLKCVTYVRYTSVLGFSKPT